MGKKLYEKTEEGGIRFSSGRKPGEVRVPNYVYDLWLPLLGVSAIGVYNLYCRLERENIVKAISLKNIANACRIGTDRLGKINEALKKCGFIEIAKPTGWKRLAHYTTEFKVLDPPREVPTWAIEKYASERGYEPLTPWLVAEEDKTPIGGPENPNGFSGEPKQGLDKDLSGTPKIATLDLQPLGVESLDAEPVLPSGKNAVSSAPPHRRADPLMQDLERETAAVKSNFATPASADGDGDLAVLALRKLCEFSGGEPPQTGSREFRSQREVIAEVLRAYRCAQAEPKVIEEAARLHCAAKGEYVNVYFKSFPADFGKYLGKAKAALQDREDDRAAARAANVEALAALDERLAACPAPPDDDAVGRQVKAALEDSPQVTRDAFLKYVWPSRFWQDDGALRVAAPDGYTRDWLENRLATTIRRVLAGFTDGSGKVKFEVEDN